MVSLVFVFYGLIVPFSIAALELLLFWGCYRLNKKAALWGFITGWFTGELWVRCMNFSPDPIFIILAIDLTLLLLYFCLRLRRLPPTPPLQTTKG
jgi:hypothetical protein